MMTGGRENYVTKKGMDGFPLIVLAKLKVNIITTHLIKEDI